MKSIVMNTKWIVLLLLGMGILFLTVGIVVSSLDITFKTTSEEFGFRYGFLGAFGGVGAILIIVAGIIYYRITKGHRRYEQLISDGNFAWAEVVDVSPNYSVNINGKSPFALRCKFSHTDGTTYMLKSKFLRFNPVSLLKDGKVKVWFDPYNVKNYYVDVDGSIEDGYIEI